MKALGSEAAKSNLKHDDKDKPVDKALVEALTMTALGSEAAKSHLKSVEQPKDGLTPEQLAALQAAAQQEKGADAAADAK